MARREYLMRLKKRIRIEGLIESKLCGSSCRSLDSQEVAIFITSTNKGNYRSCITFENLNNKSRIAIANEIVDTIREMEIETNGKAK